MDFESSSINSTYQADNNTTNTTTTATTSADAVSKMRQQAQQHQFRENKYAREILAVWGCWDREKSMFVCNVTEVVARQQMSQSPAQSYRPPQSHPHSHPHSHAQPPPQSQPQSSIPPSPPYHNIHILPVFEYLAPFYGMKYGNCGSNGRVSSLDCVHYCSNAIPMWMPIWYGVAVDMCYSHPVDTPPHPSLNIVKQSLPFNPLPHPTHQLTFLDPSTLLNTISTHPLNRHEMNRLITDHVAAYDERIKKSGTSGASHTLTPSHTVQL